MLKFINSSPSFEKFDENKIEGTVDRNGVCVTQQRNRLANERLMKKKRDKIATATHKKAR